MKGGAKNGLGSSVSLHGCLPYCVYITPTWFGGSHVKRIKNTSG